MNNANTGNRRKKIIWAVIFVVVLGIFAISTHNSSDSTQPSPTDSQKPSTQSFNKQLHPTNVAASPWVIVNKQHPLNPKTYTPDLTVPDVKLKGGRAASNMHVSTQMAPALVILFAAAQKAGYNLMLSSGYRSYEYQVSVYGKIVNSEGANQADQESARPGYSEHQTGLAADIAPASGKCDLAQCFGTTAEGQWLAANAYKYGFIVRYPVDKQAVTGYEYEPWHLRYVGSDLSVQMRNVQSETLEEFFGVSGGSAYN